LRTEDYTSNRQRKKALENANRLGESMIHDDLLPNGDHRITFDIIPSIPLTPNEILLKLLLVKLQNNTITNEQLKMLIRLEHNFELTQTTRDKILIAVQGVVGTLRDRLKSAFNL